MVCTEILDDFLHKLAGFHFLEPVVSFEVRHKIKAAMGKSKMDRQPHSYIQLVSKQQLMDKFEKAPED